MNENNGEKKNIIKNPPTSEISDTQHETGMQPPHQGAAFFSGSGETEEADAGTESGSRDEKSDADPAIGKDRIDAAVGAFYTSLLEEPVPDLMLQLLNKLERKERNDD